MFDFPQLYTKPSAETLLDTLALLTTAPPSWEGSDTEEPGDGTEKSITRSHKKTKGLQVDPEGVTGYLTGIVSNSLRWIQDDEKREEIWNRASLRLSERSGRTGMGSLTRQFRIPSLSGFFELSIHEPALTGDDLGLKTWAASYLLAKRLHTLKPLPTDSQRKLQVLELGSGTGLVGLAMASLGADVVLTDLPSIYPNLARNAQDNSDIVSRNSGSVRCGTLDWANPTTCRVYPQDESHTDEESSLLDIKFPLILAADSLYSSEHPRWLVHTIDVWLSTDAEAQVMAEFPLRDAYLPEIKDFRERMSQIGLCILEEGEEKGYDDWGAEGGDRAVVKCWWSRWARIKRT